MKVNESDLVSRAADALHQLLRDVPFIHIQHDPQPENEFDQGMDFAVQVQVGQQTWTLIAEVKAKTSPRQMRDQIVSHQATLQKLGIKRAYFVLVAPWLSPEVVSICTEAGIGTLDLQGNCHLSFGTVFIERTGHPAPPEQRRAARALFAPKSARILRLLLREPHRAWKTEDLAEIAQVSLGQVSNVRQELLERELAQKVQGGVRLSQPRRLLEAWQAEYKAPRAQRQGFYTLLHGEALDAGIVQALEAAQHGLHAVLAGPSAARWLAPYLRTASHTFYADGPGLQALSQALQLELVSKGENILVDLDPDEGVFMDRLEAAPGIWTTGPAQTYLDLAVSGERGTEAAQHLLETKLEAQWKEPA